MGSLPKIIVIDPFFKKTPTSSLFFGRPVGLGLHLRESQVDGLHIFYAEVGGNAPAHLKLGRAQLRAEHRGLLEMGSSEPKGNASAKTGRPFRTQDMNLTERDPLSDLFV